MLKQKPGFKITSSDEKITTRPVNLPKTEKGITAMSLMWIGLGGIIGAGFFLASGLPIRDAGPGVIFGYLLGGFLMAQVAGALTSLSVNHPVRGSFRVYAQEILGTFMGFFLGWAFWISSILGIGSETIAMAIFSQLWFPNMPVWLLTLIYSSIVITLNAFGVKKFGKIESFMSVVKVVALILFILLGISAMLGWLNTTHPVGIGTLLSHGGLLPHGLTGVLKSMLIVIFAYSGISVVALASSEVREPRKSIPQAMFGVIIILVVLYMASLLVVMSLIPWTQVTTDQSPFVTALQAIDLKFIPSIMNAIILVAAFSVMTGTYFSAMMMLVSLGESREAPRIVARKGKNGIFYGSLFITAAGLAAIIVASYILPGKIYAYLTSSSAYFSFLNWGTILVTFLVWRKKVNPGQYISRLAFGAPWLTILSLAAILILFVFSLGVMDQRMGFYFALGLALAISIAYLFWRQIQSPLTPNANDK